MKEMGWDGMGCDGMGWDEIGWDKYTLHRMAMEQNMTE